MFLRVLAISAVVSLVAVAQANLTRINEIVPTNDGAVESPDGDGLAILRYKRGDTDVHVLLKDFLPNTTYGVKIESSGGEYSNPLALTTNSSGNGVLRVLIVGQDLTGGVTLLVYIWDGDVDNIIDVSAAELRAIGSPVASTTRIRDLDPAGPGVTENPDVDGGAILRYRANDGDTEIFGHAKNLLPNTTYGVKIEGGAEISSPQAFTTNCAGNGHFRLTVPGDATASPRMLIYIWDGNTDPDSILDVTATEVRADSL